MEPVGVGRRAVAIIIDSILLGILGYAVAAMTGSTTESGFNLQGAPALFFFLLFLAYYVVMEKLKGATLGKLAMGLKVVKEGGEAIDWQASIVRNILRIIDGFFFYLVGAIVVWVSKKRQRLGDMAAHTIVVKARAWIPIAIVVVLAGAYPVESVAAPRYSGIVLSDQKDGKAKATFAPTTEKVFLRAKVADVPAGAKLKASWIAEKTKVAPANYKIDSYEMKTVANMNEVLFSMSKPTAGWPEGDYRVELFIDDKPAAKVPFKIAK